MNKKIMIIDDNEEYLEEMADMLEARLYDILLFSDPLEALEKINTVDPDLVIVDLKMNGISGFKLAGMIKKSPEIVHAPVIAMTGYYTRPEDSIFLSACGIDKCLIKPLDPEELIEEIEKTLEQYNKKNKEVYYGRNLDVR
jgi:DNA-binding response OmpR family regulator